MNSWMPETPSMLSAVDDTAAAHEEIGAIMQMGAAVASIMYDSFARDIFCASVTGRITAPTVRQLK